MFPIALLERRVSISSRIIVSQKMIMEILINSLPLFLATFCASFIVHPPPPAAPVAMGVVHYVTPIGAGAMTGDSWSDAAAGADLQSTIDNAQVGDSIWVACGTYFPTSTTDRSIAFHQRNGISILGSFQGSETHFSARNITCGPCSILDGNIGSPTSVFDNSYTIISNEDLDATAIIDGFRITAGYDNRGISNNGAGLGGGIYNGGGGNGGFCNPTIQNCVIDNNYAGFGAGVFNNGYNNGQSSPILNNCILADNFATNGGGGMDSYGFNNGDCAPVLNNCIFYNNVTDGSAGAIYCWGGLNGNCTTTLTNSALINNSAADLAGGIIVDNFNNSSGNFSGTAEVISSNSIFWGNTATEGPQFYIQGSGHFTATYTAIDTLGQTAANPITGAGTGNSYGNPGFLDSTNVMGMDNCWMTVDDGLTQQINSALINAGEASSAFGTDLTFNDRISGANIDIGPYEYSLPDSVSWTGDLSSDWFTNGNWNPARVPDGLQVVTIPGVVIAPTQPVVNGGIAHCADLVLEDGASLSAQDSVRVGQ